MTNNETKRFADRLITEVASRMDRVERKVDGMTEKCVGCARQFGSLESEVKSLHEAARDHVAEHKWRIGLAATIGGLVVVVAQFIRSIFWKG